MTDKKLRDSLLECLGALEAMKPLSAKFFEYIGKDIKEELPGLSHVMENAKKLLKETA